MNIRLLIGRFSKIIRGMQNISAGTENPCVGGSIPPSATKIKQLRSAARGPRAICPSPSNIQRFAAAASMLLATDFVAAIEPHTLDDTPYSETILQSQVPVIKGRMVAVCKVPVYDITAGETDRITAHVQVTNPRSQRPTGTGITAEIVICDPECEMGNLRRPYARGRSWPETMNITPKIHHAGYQPSARYVATEHRPVAWFAVLISAYGKRNGPNGGPGYVEIDRCYIEVERTAQ